MLIAALSDLHGFLPHPYTLRHYDAILIAGDICPINGEFGDHTPKTQARWLKRRFRPWCGDLNADYIVLTPGNHDAIFEERNNGIQRELGRKVALMIDELVEIDWGGPRIFSQPWIPHLKAWPFYKPNARLKELAEKIPDDADIWMFHGPPMANRPDYRLDVTKHGEHVGNQWVTPIIKERGPQLVVCGHIHEGFGLSEIGTTPIANVAFVDENYVPRYRHLEIGWHEVKREITRLEIVQTDPEWGLWRPWWSTDLESHDDRT